MTEPKKKPQLHSSHLSTLWTCGYKFQLTVLEGKREPPTTPLVVGTASHTINAHNLKNKIDRGTLLTREAVQDYARDEFLRQWQSSPIVLNEEEVSQGLAKTRDICQDQTIAVTTEYHYAVAPKLRPVGVEEPWVLEAFGFPYDLAGMVDVREVYDFDQEKGIFLPNTFMTIRDTKTRGRDMGQREVDSSEQYTLYAMAMFYIHGKKPHRIFQDTLIKPTKTKGARAISYASTRTDDDFKVFHHRFEQACKIIDKEAFTPAATSDWHCSK